MGGGEKAKSLYSDERGRLIGMDSLFAHGLHGAVSPPSPVLPRGHPVTYPPPHPPTNGEWEGDTADNVQLQRSEEIDRTSTRRTRQSDVPTSLR